MVNSRFFQVFKARCDYLKQHIEIVEVALSLVEPKIAASGQQNSNQKMNLHTALGVDGKTYPRLAKLPAKQWHIAFKNHSEKRNLEFALGELYAYFEEYIRSIVAALPASAARYPSTASNGIDLPSKSVQRILTSQATMDSILGDFIIKSIEAKRFGKGMAEGMAKVLGLGVNPRIQHYAHFILDVRNAMIHNGGLISTALNRDYGKLILDISCNNEIRIDRKFVSTIAIKSVHDYVKHLDDLLLKKDYIQPHNYNQVLQENQQSSNLTAAPLQNDDQSQ